MNCKIKPIETFYKRYRFRSRLEARWAVFFDELKIEYEYEIEGFVLFSGKRYLPDFFLPKLGLFVEVRPNLDIDLEELKRLVEFAEEYNLLLIAGVPTKESMHIVHPAITFPLDNYDGVEGGV